MSKIIWLSYGSLLVLGWLDNARSPFFPDILQSLNLNGTEGSLIFAVTSIVAFSTSVMSSRWFKRFSSYEILRLSLTGLAFGFFLISRASQFAFVLFAAAVFGAAYGILNFIENSIVHEYAPDHLRRRIFAGLHCMYGAAALFAPLSAMLFVGWGWGWRRSFLYLSALPLVFTLIARWTFPASERKHAPVEEPPHLPIPRRALWIAGLSVALYVFGEVGVSTRLVLWLRTEYGFAPETANIYLAVFFGLLLLGRVIFTAIDFSRFSNRRVMVTSASISIVLLVLALIHRPEWMPLSGLTMGPFYPVGMNHLSDLFGPRRAPTALAFAIGLGSLMTVFMHFSIGVATDLFSLHRALWLTPASFGLVILFLFLQPRVVDAPGLS